MLTQERVEKLANYLASDEERGKRLVSMPPEEAVMEINRDGYDFTVDELNEFGDGVRLYAQRESGELTDDQLEEVAGGFAWAAFGLWGLKVVGAWAVGKFLDWAWGKLK